MLPEAWQVMSNSTLLTDKPLGINMHLQKRYLSINKLLTNWMVLWNSCRYIRKSRQYYCLDGGHYVYITNEIWPQALQYSRTLAHCPDHTSKMHCRRKRFLSHSYMPLHTFGVAFIKINTNK